MPPIQPPDKGNPPDNSTPVCFTGEDAEAVSAAFDAAGMSPKLTMTVERIVKAQRAQDSDDDTTTLTLDAGRLLEVIAPVDLYYIDDVYCPATRRAHHGNPQPRRRARTRQSHRSRPGHRRRGSTSATSSSDSGDEGPAVPELIRGIACPHRAAPLHTDRNGADHCGGCAITWWEGVR